MSIINRFMVWGFAALALVMVAGTAHADNPQPGTALLGTDVRNPAPNPPSGSYGFNWYSPDESGTDIVTTVDPKGRQLAAIFAIYSCDDTNCTITWKPSGNQMTFYGSPGHNYCLYSVFGTWVGGGGGPGGFPVFWESQFKPQGPVLMTYVNNPYAPPSYAGIPLGGEATVTVELHGDSDNTDYTFVLNQSLNGGGVVSLSQNNLNNQPQVLIPSVNCERNDLSFDGDACSVDVYGAVVGTVDFTPQSENQNVNCLGTEGRVYDFAIVLTPDDNFNGRSLARVGVGETGTLSLSISGGASINALTPLTWGLSSGTQFTIGNADQNAGTAPFTAGDTDDNIVLTVTDQNQKNVTRNVTVVKPTGAYQTMAFAGNCPGRCGAYMENYTYLLPVDVSFANIQVGEGGCLGAATGSFITAHMQNKPHKAWGPKPVDKGNINLGCLVKGPNPASGALVHEFDEVEYSIPLHLGQGTFCWDIPWLYTVGRVKNVQFTTLPQIGIALGGDIMYVSKGGVCTIQGP